VSTDLPPCGLYRTVRPIGQLEAGRLVYFHNHGDPGPGFYFPEKWIGNRAQFSPKGMTAPTGFDATALEPLPTEGFYRVAEAFFCCDKQCVRFEPEQFVQLGYNGAGKPIVFVPELRAGAIAIPDRGTVIDDAAFASLVLLKVVEGKTEIRDDISMPRGIIVH